MGYNYFLLGSLYLGDSVQPIPQQPWTGGDISQYIDGTSISIGEAEPGKKITWLKPNGMNLLVADRVLLVNVSWEDLRQKGIVDGKKIVIDGYQFRLRLLQVGANPLASNEWNKVLKTTNISDSLWHWNRMRFFGSDVCGKGGYGAHCVVRGWYSANYWDDINKYKRYDHTGFRPALEPLGADDPFSNCTLDGEDFQLSKIPGSYSFCPVLRPYHKNVFADIPDGNQVKMYTAIQDGHPIQFSDKVQSLSGIELTDQYFGDEYLISWTVSNGVAVADKPLLVQYQ